MRRFSWVVMAIFVALMLASMLLPPTRDEAKQFFRVNDIEDGLSCSQQRRIITWGSTFVELALLFYLTARGPALASLGNRITGNRRMLTLVFVGLVCFLAQEIFVSIPFGWLRLEQTRAWNLTQRPPIEWFIDHLKMAGIMAGGGLILLIGFGLLVGWLPRLWWLVAAVGSVGFSILTAMFWPVYVEPLFNTFTPLKETRWKNYEPRVRKLIDRAKIPVADVLIIDASRQSSHSNAYFTGFGDTRRIVLYDTLVKNSTPDEIESVLAHEIGHWQHDHIVKGLAIGSLGALAGFLGLHLLMRRLGRDPADPSQFPFVLLLGFLATWAVMPVQNVISRHFERQADQVSLELGGQPDAFIKAEIQLARDNVMNVAPHPFNVWLFSSHPTPIERIQAAVERKKN